MDFELGRDELDLLLRIWEALVAGASDRIASGLVDRRRTTQLKLDRENLSRIVHLLAVQSETGVVTWRSLPQIRTAAMKAVDRLATGQTSEWTARRGALLFPPVGNFQERPGSDLSRGVDADATVLLTTGYPFWNIRPPSAKEFHRRTGRLFDEMRASSSVSPMHPLERLSVQTVDATKGLRAAISVAFRELCERPGMILTSRHRRLIELLMVPKVGRRPHADEVELAVALYRAYKLATFARAGQYLDGAYPDWCVQLGVDVPFAAPGGIESLPRNLTPVLPDPDVRRALRRLPVPGRWVRLWSRWVEPYDFRLTSRFPELADRVDARLNLPTAKDEPEVTARLGAIFELAASDIELRQPAGIPLGSPTALADWLLQLMLYDDVATTLKEQVRTSRRMTDQPWQPPPRTRFATTRPASGSGDPLAKDRLKALREAVDLLDRGTGQTATLLRRHFDDPEVLHEWTLLLRRRSADPDDRRRSNDHTRMLTGLIRGIGLRLQLDERGHDRARAFMPALQAMSVDLLNSRPDALAVAFRPALLVATPTTAGPYTANVYRSLAIAHSKRHRYVEALGLLAYANGWLEAVQMRTPQARQDDDWVRAATETAQQLALQSNGLHVRVFEWLASHPAYNSPLSAGTEERVSAMLRAFSKQALYSAGNALTMLETIKRSFTLPAERPSDRAASAAWEANTRMMYMRALLCRAMIHALDSAADRQRSEDRQRDAHHANIFCDAIPLLYQETTAVPLSVANLCELTRICLHYAFLCGLQFLHPARGSIDLLPPHLALPDAHGRFDSDAASTYLMNRRNDAGILASITFGPLRAVLDRRSRPHDWTGESPYAKWIAIPEIRYGLRRSFVPAELLRTTTDLLAPIATIHIPQ